MIYEQVISLSFSDHHDPSASVSEHDQPIHGKLHQWDTNPQKKTMILNLSVTDCGCHWILDCHTLLNCKGSVIHHDVLQW